jgi:putative transposase
LEAEVRAASLLTLAELNRALAAWLAVDYHQQVHSETQQTPHRRYHDHRGVLRHVHLPAVLRFFHQRVERTVNDDYSDVQLENLFFRVDLGLRGDKVIVEYDPFAPLEEVQLYSLAGVYLGVGRRYQREKGSHPPLPPVAPAGPVQPHYLDALRTEYEAFHAQRRASGIDYRSAQESSRWPLTAFAGQFARLLGRKAGLSAVTAEEMEILAAFYARHPALHEGLLKEAFRRAASSSIPDILFSLQTLLHERNR